MKIINLEEILDEIGDSLDKIFLVSANMLVAQYIISAHSKSTLIFQ